jgi:hypothetical protein
MNALILKLFFKTYIYVIEQSAVYSFIFFSLLCFLPRRREGVLFESKSERKNASHFIDSQKSLSQSTADGVEQLPNYRTFLESIINSANPNCGYSLVGGLEKSFISS